jgi:hypothetical protein
MLEIKVKEKLKAQSQTYHFTSLKDSATLQSSNHFYNLNFKLSNPSGFYSPKVKLNIKLPRKKASKLYQFVPVCFQITFCSELK